MKILSYILMGVLALAFLVGISALVGFIFMLLWNAVVAGVFGGPVLSFIQAWLLWILIGFVGNALRNA